MGEVQRRIQASATVKSKEVLRDFTERVLDPTNPREHIDTNRSEREQRTEAYSTDQEDGGAVLWKRI